MIFFLEIEGYLNLSEVKVIKKEIGKKGSYRDRGGGK
jgi:hypothetical protein